MHEIFPTVVRAMQETYYRDAMPKCRGDLVGLACSVQVDSGAR